MAKLIFKYSQEDDVEINVREAKEIQFEVPDDMNINEFKVVCIRMAAAMGYHHKSITKAFGAEESFNSEEGLKQLLNELNDTRNYKGNFNQS
jgi:hypothetical protein